MKFRNLFFGALAGLAFAACSSDDETMQVTDSVESVKGNAYIAVRLSMVSDAQTRAWTNNDGDNGDYEVGSTEEVGVTDAQFFFFNEDGSGCANPYYVDASSWGWQNVNNNTIDKESNLVDSKLEGVVVLSNATTWPVKMVAVLNPTAEIKNLGKTATLSQLANTIGGYEQSGESSFASIQEKKFLMSNAVYVANGSVINAATVTTDNIQKTQELAKEKPVTVYVERVLAKVRVLKSESVSGSKTIKVKNEKGEEIENTITVNVDGWWLDNTNKNSYLLKSLDASYSFTPKQGVTPTENWWNDANNFRSYWANAWSKDDALDSENFKSYKYEDRKTTFDKTTEVYCFENTSKNNLTQLVVTATLNVTENGSSHPVSLVSYGGSYYTENTLKILLASENSIVKKYYKKITAEQYEALQDKSAIVADAINTKYYQRITSEDLAFVHDAADDELRYYSRLDVISGTYYTNDNGTMTQVSSNEVIKTDFENLGKFKFWAGGRTYFFLPINQYADVTDAEGVIRNHIYELNITSIAGLGTPIPSTDVVINPQYPEADTESHLAARVAILKYRVIKQDVQLEDPSTKE